MERIQPMELFVWLIGLIIAAVVSYFVNELLEKFIRDPKRRYRYGIVAVVFLLAFITVALLASAKARDTARALLASSDDRRCYFSRIATPEGSATEKDAPAFRVPFDTPISWEPKNCILVVQSYQNNVLLEEKKGQRSNEVTVQEVGRTGVTEIKIFRDGFETASSNTWIDVVP
jgi:hypothetical protein